MADREIYVWPDGEFAEEPLDYKSDDYFKLDLTGPWQLAVRSAFGRTKQAEDLIHEIGIVFEVRFNL